MARPAASHAVGKSLPIDDVLVKAPGVRWVRAVPAETARPAQTVLALSPPGRGTRTYVTNGGSNSVSVIDIATNAVTATIGVGFSPGAVAVNPAGTRAYVTNFGSDTVSVIDTATKAVTATIGVGSNPTGVAVNPGGTLAYVTDYSSDAVSVILL